MTEVINEVLTMEEGLLSNWGLARAINAAIKAHRESTNDR